MKHIILYLLLLTSISSIAQTTTGTHVTIKSGGYTKAQTDSAVALKSSWFNIKAYGASTSGTAAANTTAINAAITAALADSGTIYIPKGTYSVNQIAYNPKVGIVGDGSGSILKSASAVSLLSYTSNTVVGSYNTVRNITLDGNSIGTIGLEYYDAVSFNFDNVRFQGFTSECVFLKGSLIGSFDNCIFYNSGSGVVAVSNPSSSVGVLQSNLVTFNNCVFNTISKWGMNWTNAASIGLNQCDFEKCGTVSDFTTGAIKDSAMTPATEVVASIIDKCWFEANNGWNLWITNPHNVYGFDATTIIRNTILTVLPTAAGIYVQGTNSKNNKVYIYNSKVRDSNTFDMYADGANAYIFYKDCVTLSTKIVANAGATIVNNDNQIGLGTLSPAHALDMAGNSNIDYGVQVRNLSTGTGAYASLRLGNSADVSEIWKAGTNVPSYKNTAPTDFVMYSGATGNLSFLNDYASGNINFAAGGSSTAQLILNPNGTVKMSNYGAGTATFDASGNITSVSDERLKNIFGFYRTGLKELMNIKPIIYKWNKKSGNETDSIYAGFSAQNVKANIPYGTGVNKDGYLSLQDRAIMATLVNAVKEQQIEIESLKKEIKLLKKE